jgi:hypothetical protein
MIGLLAEHGVTAADLVPSLVTTHTVPNPEYDPNAAAKTAEHDEVPVQPAIQPQPPSDPDQEGDLSSAPEISQETVPRSPPHETSQDDTTPSVDPNLIQPLPNTLPGVSTTLTSADATVTLDIRWTVLCDLFLALIADSVYDARSRVLLCSVAERLGLDWLDVVRFEKRLTEALEIEEGVQDGETVEFIAGRKKRGKKRRVVMMGLATLG